MMNWRYVCFMYIVFSFLVTPTLQEYWWKISESIKQENGKYPPDLYFKTDSNCLSLAPFLEIHDNVTYLVSFYFNGSTVTKKIGSRDCEDHVYEKMNTTIIHNIQTFDVTSSPPTNEDEDDLDLDYVGDVVNCGYPSLNESQIEIGAEVYISGKTTFKTNKPVSYYPVLVYPFETTDFAKKFRISIITANFLGCFSNDEEICVDYHVTCFMDDGTTFFAFQNGQENPYEFYNELEYYIIPTGFFIAFVALCVLIGLFCNLFFICAWCCYGCISQFNDLSESNIVFFTKIQGSKKEKNTSDPLDKKKIKGKLSFITIIINILGLFTTHGCNICIGSPLIFLAFLWSVVGFFVDFMVWAFLLYICVLVVMNEIGMWIFDIMSAFLFEYLAFKVIVSMILSVVFNPSDIIDLYFLFNDIVEDSFILMIPFFGVLSNGLSETGVKIIILVFWALKIDNILYQYCFCVCCPCEPVLDWNCCSFCYNIIEIGWKCFYAIMKKKQKSDDDDDDDDSDIELNENQNKKHQKDEDGKKKKNKKEEDQPLASQKKDENNKKITPSLRKTSRRPPRRDSTSKDVNKGKSDDSSDVSDDDEEEEGGGRIVATAAVVGGAALVPNEMEMNPLEIGLWIFKEVTCGVFRCCYYCPSSTAFLFRVLELFFLLLPFVSFICGLIYIIMMELSPDAYIFAKENQLLYLLVMAILFHSIFSAALLNGMAALFELFTGGFVGKILNSTLGIVVVVLLIFFQWVALVIQSPYLMSLEEPQDNPDDVLYVRMILQEHGLVLNFYFSLIFNIVFDFLACLFFGSLFCVAVCICPFCSILRCYRFGNKICDVDDKFPPLKCLGLLFTNYD